MSYAASTSKKRRLEEDIREGRTEPIFPSPYDTVSEWKIEQERNSKIFIDKEREEMANKIQDLENQLGKLNVTDQIDTSRPIIKRERAQASREPNDVYKWGLRFSGESSVLDFIESCEDRLRSRRVSGTALVQAFTELLSGAALKWYRSIRTDNLTWSELKKKLIERFESLNYQIKMDSQIRNMKQKSTQNIEEYITEVRGVNALLRDPIKDSTLLEILKMNVAEKYKPILGSQILSTVEELVKYAKNFEQYLTKEVVKPHRDDFKGDFRRRAVATVSGEIGAGNTRGGYSGVRGGYSGARGGYSGARGGCSSSRGEHSANRGRGIGRGMNRGSFSGPYGRRSDNTFCLKCETQGHHFSECRKILGKICFGCRLEGVTRAECTGCNANNSKGNSRELKKDEPRSRPENSEN